MSNEIDFKALWNREETNAPDISEIFARAHRFNRNSRKRILISNALLILAIVLYAFIWWHFQPQFITTKIGMMLIMTAMAIYVISTYQLYPLLGKVNLETDSHEFLSQMIRIKHKQEFIDKMIAAIYFLSLAAGLTLYYIEYLRRGSVLFQVCVYVITLVLLALNWFFLQTRSAKKRHKVMNEIINKLEAVNAQLED